MGGHMFRRPVGGLPAEDSCHRRHAGVRMVHTCVDLRVERHTVLRRHLPGREQNAQNRVVLDELHVLRHFHHRADAQMDRVGNTQVLQKLLDGFGLHHRIGNVKRAKQL